MCSSPVSTAWKAIGVGDVCLVGSIEKDTSPSTTFANVSESSPQSSRTKHVVTFLGLSCRHTSSACVGFRKQVEWGTLCIRGHVPNVLFDRRHIIQFFLSIPSIVDDDCLLANVMSEKETCPYLCSYLSSLRKKGKLVHLLAPAAR